MNEEMILREIESMRAEIRLLDDRLTKVERDQCKIDEILDRIAVLDSKIDAILDSSR